MLDFEDMAKQEMAVYDAFVGKYERMFPTSENTKITFWQAVGWQFVLIMIQASGAIVLASLRTAEMFYIAASASNAVLRYTEAVAAILAIEFGIVVFAAIRAEAENRKKSVEEIGEGIRVSVKALVIGEVIGVLISIVAGLGVSFIGFGIDLPWFKYILSVLIGSGASIIAAISGHILGAMLARFGNLQEYRDVKYKNYMKEWRENLSKSWESSPERAIIRDGITAMRQSLLDQRKAKSSPVRSVPNEQRTNERTNEPKISPTAQKIFDYLDENNNGTDAPSNKELVAALGVSKGYASDQAKLWREMRGFPVVEDELAEEVNAPIQ